MMELSATWRLLQELRSDVYLLPPHLEKLQDSLFRDALLHAYEHVPFYRRYWDETGFDPKSARGTKDIRRVPVMTREMALHAVMHDELLAKNFDSTRRTLCYTTGSSGQQLCITEGRDEKRLWRAQGSRIWFQHGFRWWDKKAQFYLRPEPPHFLQRIGISRTDWIAPDFSLEKLRENYLRSKADWIIATSTVIRRLSNALAAAGGQFHQPRGIFCQGEVVDRQTTELCRRTFGLPPIALYAMSEVGYMAWQCERREGLHMNSDTHLIEVIREGEPVGPGGLGRVVVTDLRNRTMPFLRYDTGDLAVVGNGLCRCGRQFPCLQSIEGRQRDTIQLKDGRIITPRSLVDHIGQLLSPDEYRLHQETKTFYRLELSSDSIKTGDIGPHEPLPQRNKQMIEKHLRELLGDVEISIQTSRTWVVSPVKTYPILVGSPAPFV